MDGPIVAALRELLTCFEFKETRDLLVARLHVRVTEGFAVLQLRH